MSTMRRPMMSGHCSTPSKGSHDRCERRGAGHRANPEKAFTPCPCSCHLGEEYECGSCGRPIREAPRWPNEGEPDEMVYVHIEPKTGRAIGEECA